jgi:hypothetical protein
MSSTIEYIQLLQLERIYDIFHLFHTPLGPHDDWRYYSGLVHVGLFMKLAGVFWKNPMILDRDEMILGVLQLLKKSSVMMLLPHLKEWFHSSATPGESAKGYVEFNSPDIMDSAAFRTCGIGSFKREEGNVCFYTVNGLYRGFLREKHIPRHGPRPSNEECRQLQALRNSEQKAKYPVLRLVDDAEPQSWWIVGLGDQIYQEYWFLVNFEKRIFWHTRLRDVICVWSDGDGIWSPELWGLVEAASGLEPHKAIGEVLNEMENGGSIDGDGESEEDISKEAEGNNHSESSVNDDGDDGDESYGEFIPDPSDFFFDVFSKAFK